MPCLRLRLNKLPPARKAWKIFTSNLQKKLSKFHRAPATAVKLTYTTGGSSRQTRPHHRPLPLAGYRKTVAAAKGHPSYNNHAKHHPHQPRRYLFKKKSKPVFVDKLFKETTGSSGAVAATVGACKNAGVGLFSEKPLGGAVAVAAGSSHGCMEVDGAAAFGPPDGGREPLAGEEDHDRMWESMGLESPLMQNIDDRAEAFISKFRADMKRQEAMARRQPL
ncbi:hypothetical protein SAY86_028192 [Trapa natans]|uniref:Uncharacterized protein n=1 Tax=Trapa natans TaxID=22666 RepID=A0AAN7LYW9_TRANT|nr:hypothetical protein SAY86_028192 [Trapa natans]